MNQTIVPSISNPGAPDAAAALSLLVDGLSEWSPQLRKAAEYVVDNPNEVGLYSIREMAGAAAVKPNTLVRMARAAGYGSYEAFRAPFRDALKTRGEGFPDRARWLQALARRGRLGGLYGAMAASALANVEGLFAGHRAEDVKAAADAIVAARATYVLGVGALNPPARQFAYLASMALDNVRASPMGGGSVIDEVARAGAGDVVLAMSFEPYRDEIVTATRAAAEQGAHVVALTDSRASPIALCAKAVFIAPTESPQFFTSMVAVAAFLETLIAFVIADAPAEVVASIERFHERRRALGVYWEG